jgi:hypothetical protein
MRQVANPDPEVRPNGSVIGRILVYTWPPDQKSPQNETTMQINEEFPYLSITLSTGRLNNLLFRTSWRFFL